MGALDENAVHDKLREAAGIWPGVTVSAETFGSALAATIERTGATIEELHAADLYLALGCLERQPAAIALLKEKIFGQIRGAIERQAKGGPDADDILQTTIEQLVFGPPPAQPKLAQYTGRGPLHAWVRVVAIRESLQARRRLKREHFTDDAAALEDKVFVGHDAALLQAKHAASFRSAIQEALRRLDSEQRSILRFHVLDRLTIDQLAPLLGVHRATAARRLEKARADALEHTKAILRERHGLSDSEARSLCRDLVNEVDVSIGRALESTT